MHIVFHSLSQMSSQGCNNIATPFNPYCHKWKVEFRKLNYTNKYNIGPQNSGFTVTLVD